MRPNTLLLLLLLAAPALMRGVGAAGFSLRAGGCTPKKAPGLHEETIEIDGLTRRFMLHVPETDVAHPPALVSIHGYSSNPYYYSLLAGTARFNDDQYYNETVPDAVGSFEYMQSGYKMLVALPFGTAKKESKYCCPAGVDAPCPFVLDKSNPCSYNAGGCCGDAPSRGVDDIKFVKAMADFLVSEMCADADNLFAMGFSNGGMMTNRVGCELAETFKGIAPFDGPIKVGGDFKACEPARPLSVVQFCGAKDSVCNGGIASTMKTWGKNAGCDVDAEPAPTYQSKTTHCQQYKDCAEGVFVEWCMIDGLGHEFSGHLRPGNAGSASKPDYGYQPATNVDGYRYVMNRFSTLLP